MFSPFHSLSLTPSSSRKLPSSPKNPNKLVSELGRGRGRFKEGGRLDSITEVDIRILVRMTWSQGAGWSHLSVGVPCRSDRQAYARVIAIDGLESEGPRDRARQMRGRVARAARLKARTDVCAKRDAREGGHGRRNAREAGNSQRCLHAEQGCTNVQGAGLLDAWGQTYSRTERLRNTNPTTPNSTQSELKWVQIKDPKHFWKVQTIIWITKQFQNRLDETNPTSPRSPNSDIIKALKCLINERSQEPNAYLQIKTMSPNRSRVPSSNYSTITYWKESATQPANRATTRRKPKHTDTSRNKKPKPPKNLSEVESCQRLRRWRWRWRRL
ncbi:hypothetical protein M5K25_020326 [Dendrobium thyrsiflorum]|uniref:Uncharacterized protein n=1 Tax=Dendrobium thyrsiflorum TaxID=117978 RepID=A0ABD0U9K0_DENTH